MSALLGTLFQSPFSLAQYTMRRMASDRRKNLVVSSIGPSPRDGPPTNHLQRVGKSPNLLLLYQLLSRAFLAAQGLTNPNMVATYQSTTTWSCMFQISLGRGSKVEEARVLSKEVTAVCRRQSQDGAYKGNDSIITTEIAFGDSSKPKARSARWSSQDEAFK